MGNVTNVALYFVFTGSFIYLSGRSDHFSSTNWGGSSYSPILFDDHTGKDISTTLSAGAYFIFSATAGPYVAYQQGFVDKIKQYWWKFVIIGIADFYSKPWYSITLQYPATY